MDSPWRGHLTGVDEGAVVSKAHADAPQDPPNEQHGYCVGRCSLQCTLPDKTPQNEKEG